MNSRFQATPPPISCSILAAKEERFSCVDLPLVTSRHMKVVNSPAVVMQTAGKNVGRRVFTPMNEHLEVHGFLCVASVDVTSSLLQHLVRQRASDAITVLRFSLLSSSVTLRVLLFSNVLQEVCFTFHPRLLSRVHSCSSSSSRSSSMMSI